MGRRWFLLKMQHQSFLSAINTSVFYTETKIFPNKRDCGTCRDTTVSTGLVSGLQSGEPSSISGRDIITTTNLAQRDLFLWCKSDRSLKLTSHLYLVPSEEFDRAQVLQKLTFLRVLWFHLKILVQSRWYNRSNCDWCTQWSKSHLTQNKQKTLNKG